MQEDVENRTVNLAITTTKLSFRSLYAAYVKYKRYRADRKIIKEQKKAQRTKAKSEIHGKQSVKELVGQNQGVSNMEIAKTDLKGFERVTRKYGVDYAIRKDPSQDPPRYIVFFKARDADALSSAFKEYSSQMMRKEKRPSVLKQLKKFKALVASIPDKVRNKDKEHAL
ncbi:MAG: PcfB family protein [Lachnospiraceae bacterium]|nr:PcfB family protein [Lachnospiraceae bacterium]